MTNDERTEAAGRVQGAFCRWMGMEANELNIEVEDWKTLARFLADDRRAATDFQALIIDSESSPDGA